jgi:hypothetical protein
MSNRIRPYKASDYQMIRSWWAHYKEPGPLPSMIPLESSFILEIDNIPALMICVIITNVKEYCLLENFVGNPLIDNEKRRNNALELIEYVTIFTKQLGIKRLICMAYKTPLKKRYQELGFTEVLDGISTFCKLSGLE